ncbi:unnamed protein product, partial [Trichobilharzia regenti]
NSTSLSETETSSASPSPSPSASPSSTSTSQRHFIPSTPILHDETIKVTVYPYEPQHGIRSAISQTSYRPQSSQKHSSPLPSSSPRHHLHHHDHHHKQFVNSSRSSQSQIRSDEQTMPKMSTTDVIYEYEA